MKTKDKIEKSNEINLRCFLYTFAQDKKLFKNARRIVEYLISQGALETFKQAPYSEFIKTVSIPTSSVPLALNQLKQKKILVINQENVTSSYMIHYKYFEHIKKLPILNELSTKRESLLYFQQLKELLFKSALDQDFTHVDRQVFEYICALGSLNKFIDFPMPKQCAQILKINYSAYFHSRKHLIGKKYIIVNSSQHSQKIQLLS